MLMRENEVFFCGASVKEGRGKVQIQKYIYIKKHYIYISRSINTVYVQLLRIGFL